MKAALDVLDAYTTKLCGSTVFDSDDLEYLRVELGQHLADDLGRLVGGERLAAFGLGHLGGEVLDRVNAADENVAQRFAAGVGILERLARPGRRPGPATSPRRGRGSWPPDGR